LEFQPLATFANYIAISSDA